MLRFIHLRLRNVSRNNNLESQQTDFSVCVGVRSWLTPPRTIHQSEMNHYGFEWLSPGGCGDIVLGAALSLLTCSLASLRAFDASLWGLQ